MHAGTFFGGAWGGGRVFVFGFPGFPAGVSGHPGYPGFPGFWQFWMSCCVSMCRVIMCQMLVRACKTLHLHKWAGLCTSEPGQKSGFDRYQENGQACFGCLSLMSPRYLT